MKNISDGSIWDSGAWSSGEDTGHYIFVKVTGAPEGTIITFELVGGTHDPVELSSDLSIIARITDKDNQSLKITAVLGTDTITKTYSLAGLTLAS